MLTVYLIDGDTRLILPGSAWGTSVREKLTEMGHRVEPLSQDPDSCKRDEDEMSRMRSILDSTGL